MKASKKLLSLLLVLVMMIGIIPFQALAEGDSISVTLVFTGEERTPDTRTYTPAEDATTVTAQQILNEVAPGWSSAYNFVKINANGAELTSATAELTLADIGNNSVSITLGKITAPPTNDPDTGDGDDEEEEEEEQVQEKIYVTLFQPNDSKWVDVEVKTGEAVGTLPVYPAPAGKQFAGWYTGKEGQGTQLTSDTVWAEGLSKNYYPHFTLIPAQSYTLKVYAVLYANGSQLFGTDPVQVYTTGIAGTEQVLTILAGRVSSIETNVGSYGTWSDKSFFSDSSCSDSKKVPSGLYVTGDKNVYIKVNVKTERVYLHIHQGSNANNTTDTTIQLSDFWTGREITKSWVSSFLKNKYGKTIDYKGLYTTERWDRVKGGVSDQGANELTIPEGGMDIHIWTAGKVSSATADPSNPKTGDYILDTAVTLMVISGLAAAAVYVIGKKRRV